MPRPVEQVSFCYAADARLDVELLVCRLAWTDWAKLGSDEVQALNQFDDGRDRSIHQIKV